MIDIHSHVVPEVDDGSRSIASSLEILKAAQENGVTDIICTPHYRRSLFETDVNKIKEKFAELKAANDTSVNLYLGQEVAYSQGVFDRLDRGETLTMNGTKYVLWEFSYTNFTDIGGVVFESKLRGYKPIIAHIERYEYLSLDDVEELFFNGALIQINADSILHGSHYHSVAKKYLKKGFVHFIANDIHSGRQYIMQKAYKTVRSKYGEEFAGKLFNENAKILLKNDGN